MGVAESIDGDAAEKIEIFLAGGVEDIGAAAMGHHHGLTLVRRQKELAGIEQPSVMLRFARSRAFRLGLEASWRFPFYGSPHHATERAA